MRSVVKIPLEVTVEQAAILDSQSKIANWLYNRLLETANTLRKQYREARAKGNQKRADEIGLTLYTQRGLRNLIPELKAASPFVKAVYSSVLKNAALLWLCCGRGHPARDPRVGLPGRELHQPSYPG